MLAHCALVILSNAKFKSYYTQAISIALHARLKRILRLLLYIVPPSYMNYKTFTPSKRIHIYKQCPTRLCTPPDDFYTRLDYYYPTPPTLITISKHPMWYKLVIFAWELATRKSWEEKTYWNYVCCTCLASITAWMYNWNLYIFKDKWITFHLYAMSFILEIAEMATTWRDM